MKLSDYKKQIDDYFKNTPTHEIIESLKKQGIKIEDVKKNV